MDERTEEQIRKRLKAAEQFLYEQELLRRIGAPTTHADRYLKELAARRRKIKEQEAIARLGGK